MPPRSRKKPPKKTAVKKKAKKKTKRAVSSSVRSSATGPDCDPPTPVAPTFPLRPPPQHLAEPDSIARRLAWHMVLDILSLGDNPRLSRLQDQQILFIETLQASEDEASRRAGARLLANTLRHERACVAMAVDYAKSGLEAFIGELLQKQMIGAGSGGYESLEAMQAAVTFAVRNLVVRQAPKGLEVHDAENPESTLGTITEE